MAKTLGVSWKNGCLGRDKKNGDTIAKLDKIREEKRTKCIDSYY